MKIYRGSKIEIKTAVPMNSVWKSTKSTVFVLFYLMTLKLNTSVGIYAFAGIPNSSSVKSLGLVQGISP